MGIIPVARAETTFYDSLQVVCEGQTSRKMLPIIDSRLPCYHPPTNQSVKIQGLAEQETIFFPQTLEISGRTWWKYQKSATFTARDTCLSLTAIFCLPAAPFISPRDFHLDSSKIFLSQHFQEIFTMTPPRDFCLTTWKRFSPQDLEEWCFSAFSTATHGTWFMTLITLSTIYHVTTTALNASSKYT